MEIHFTITVLPVGATATATIYGETVTVAADSGENVIKAARHIAEERYRSGNTDFPNAAAILTGVTFTVGGD